MPFIHRLPALGTATLASSALSLGVLSAMVCDFVEIDAIPGSLLISADGEELMKVTETFGLFCVQEFYDGDDQMWKLSRVFFYLTASLGGCATILAWALAIALPPTSRNWRWLSLLSAATAVLGVPVFLIFSAQACTDSVEIQTCSLYTGSYYLMCSAFLWVIITLSTQCLDPPSWGEEMASWQIAKHVEAELAIKAFKPQRRSVYPVAEMSLPAVRTDSMKDDEFDLHSPSQISDHSISSAPRQEAWQIEGTAPVSPPLQPSQIQTMSISQFVPTAPQSSGRPQTSGRLESSASKYSPSKMPAHAQSTSMILEDLKSFEPETDKGDKGLLRGADTGNEDKYLLGIRALTQKLSQHTHHRRLGRRPQRGYERMFDGHGSDSDSEPMSPPIEVEIKPFAHFDDEDFDGADHENQDLMNDWNALHKATTAGVRMGIQDGYNNTDEWIDFTAPVENYYSDPEPAIYSSDEEEEEDESNSTQRSAPSNSRQGGDASTISGLSGSQTRSLDGKKSRRKTRRKHPPVSPARSIKSSGESLLDVTIDEETDLDVLEEISDEDAQGILGAYKLSRTMSDPTYVHNQRNISSDVRDTLWPVEAKSLEQPRVNNRSQYDDTSALQKSSSSAFGHPIPAANTRAPIVTGMLYEPIISPDFGATERRLEVIDRPIVSQRFDSIGAKSASAITPNRRQFETKSLSPPRLRPPYKTETFKTETWRREGMNTQRSTMSGFDASMPVGSNVSDILRQAREFRIQRMQHENESKIDGNDTYIEDRLRASKVSHIRKEGGVTHRIGSPQTSDPVGAYSEFLPRKTAWLDAEGWVDEDFSELKTEVKLDNLPMFTVTSPGSMRSTNDGAPELSPISKTSGAVRKKLPFSNDDGREEFPTMTTAGESDIEDEFAAVSLIRRMEGIEKNSASSSEEQFLAEDDFEKYGSLDMDDLDLQLIAVQRPLGQEYGDEESSI